MWLPYSVADPLKIRTPVWRSTAPAHAPGVPKVYGPLIVNCRIVTSAAPSTRTIEFGCVITRGALMIAWSGTCEKSNRPSLPGPIRTCS